MKPKPNPTAEQKRKEKEAFALKIGKHLKEIRENKGLSQEALSEEAGYYRTYVNKIETGKYSPSLHTIWRLSDALGLTLKEFFKNF